MAVKAWLIEHEPGLAEEIYLDVDPHTGIRPGARWKQALQQANARCEAVICLLSKHWEASPECRTEFRYAETLNKAIVVARLEPVSDTNITSEWQRCDPVRRRKPPQPRSALNRGEPVVLPLRACGGCWMVCARWGLRRSISPGPRQVTRSVPRIGGGHRWRRPMRRCSSGATPRFCAAWMCCAGCAPAEWSRCLWCSARRERASRRFLRAGLLPRLRRDDRTFLPMDIVRPERAVLTAELGLAHAIHELRADLGLPKPMLGEIKNACHPENVEHLRGWLEEARQAARARLLDVVAEQPAPPWCCRWIRPRNCSAPTPHPRPRGSWRCWPPWCSMRPG